MEEKTIIPSAGIIKEVQKKIKNKEFNTLKLVELKKISKEIGLKGTSKLKKDYLINLIKEFIANDESDKKSTPKITLKKESTSKKNFKDSDNKKLDKKDTSEDYISKYKRLSVEKINNKLEEIFNSSNWFHKNREIQDLIQIFKDKYNRESKKAEKKFFNQDSEGKTFIFKPEFKIKFDEIIFEYKNKRKKYFKDLENIQNKNFEKKLEIIENIKKLIDKNTGDFEKKYIEFKKNKENWHNIGPVPRSKDQNLWQTFRHHVERFYDLLHLNRKFREADFKHNYKEKLKIIENAELLVNEKDIIKATRNINILHKKWKNELGPVEKKHRELLWKRFQLATKKIQKNRKEFQKNAIKSINQNIISREEILKKMKSLTEQMPNNHLDWQKRLINFQKLREEFKNIGYVPNKDGKLLWKNFRDYSKIFMNSKNDFYKNQKEEYKNKISQKKDLINEINFILKSDDWDEKLETVKKNQSKWKSIGFIPRKIDNKLWKDFSNLNNLYFERIKSGYNKLNENETKLYNLKKDLINKINTLKVPKEINKAITKIEKEIINWNKVGKLNKTINNKLNIEFSKSLITLVKSNKSIIEIKEDLIFEIRLKLAEYNIENSNDLYNAELKKEKSLINELNQLENNLEFFTNSSSENPLFKDVENKIKTIKTQIEVINKKKKRINTLYHTNEKNDKIDEKNENEPSKS